MAKKKSSKKWSRDRTRREYVQSEDDIGLRALAKQSGNSESAVFRWSREDDWTRQRQQYRSKVDAAIQEKAIETISDRLSESYAEIAVRHYKGYKKFTDISNLIVTLKAQKLSRAVASGELSAIAEAEAALNSIEINNWSLVYDRSCKGEAVSVGLKFEVDNNAAVAYAEKEGYAIIEKDYLEELQELQRSLNQ